MPDEVTSLGRSAHGSIPLTPLSAGVGGLEPLAVPLGKLTSILRRQLWVVLLAFSVGMGAAVLIVSISAKQYSAEIAILIEPQRTQVSDLQAISPDPGDVGGLVRTQVDILKSQTLIIGAVKALKLTEYPEFAPKDGGILAGVTSLLQRLKLQPVVERPPMTEETAIEIAGSILSSKIAFLNETRSSVLRLIITTQDPQLSADIGNEIAKQFLDFKRHSKFAAMQRAHDWFQEQMGSLSEQLRTDDAAVERYRREHRLDEQPPEESGVARSATINRQQLDTISHQLVDVSRERARKEGQLAQAQAAARGEISGNTLSEVLASPGVAQLLAQTAAAAGREAQLSSAQGTGHPELVAARAQLKSLQLRTAQEVANVISSLYSDVRAARMQEETLQRQMLQLRSEVSGENSAQIGLQSLLTKARATRSIYESFLTRATQLANVSGIQEPDASLVSSAHPPLGPSAPQVKRIILVAAIMSLVLGIALACVVERLRSGFSQPEQVEQTLGLPLIALLPSVPAATFHGRRRSRSSVALTASLDQLRAQLRALGDEQPKVLMVTSAVPKEGKSIFAAELARNVAGAGWRVLLIECDFGCPSLARHFRLRPGPGLCEILTGDFIGDRSSIVHEPQPRLHLIVSGSMQGDPQEQLASKRMTALLHEARERYDLVVLDTPSVLPVADALVLAGQADATLMVVRWEKTGRAAAQDAMRLLRTSRARFMGAVMTRVDLRTAAKCGGRMSHAFNRYDGYHLTRNIQT